MARPVTGTITNCPHTSAKHCAKGMCRNCYTKTKRAEYAKNPTYRATQVRRSQSWRKRNPEARRTQAYKEKLRKAFGLTLGQYAAMSLAQRHRCAICRELPVGKVVRLDVDHCHNTHKIRGLLCRRCNTGLGQFRDNPALLQKASAYLQEAA